MRILCPRGAGGAPDDPTIDPTTDPTPKNGALVLDGGAARAVVVEIPLRSGESFTVTEAMADEWAITYPAVNVRQTLRVIAEWNRSNPTRRKTARRVRHHVTSWLAREQEKSADAGPTGGDEFPDYADADDPFPGYQS